MWVRMVKFKASIPYLLANKPGELNPAEMNGRPNYFHRVYTNIHPTGLFA